MTRPDEPEKDVASGTRTLVVGAYLSRRRRSVACKGARPAADNPRSFEARLEEAAGLAAAIDLQVVQTMVVAIASPTPATLIGKGKVEELAGIARSLEIGLVMMDCAAGSATARNPSPPVRSRAR